MTTIKQGAATPALPYVHQEFPKMLHHPTQKAVVVNDPGEQEKYEEQGYTTHVPDSPVPPDASAASPVPEGTCTRCNSLRERFDASWKGMEQRVEHLDQSLLKSISENETLRSLKEALETELTQLRAKLMGSDTQPADAPDAKPEENADGKAEEKQAGKKTAKKG